MKNIGKFESDSDTLESGAAALGINLNEKQIQQFRILYSELTDWNSRLNLTSITGWEQTQSRHFLDSLAGILALPSISEDSSMAVLDVGSGAGFPGFPIKISFPNLHVSVLESSTKKISFLSHVVETLGLEHLEILEGRAETFAHNTFLRENFDVVVSRAVAKLPVLAELTLPFCRIGGTVIAYKSEDIEREVKYADNSIRTMGGKLRTILQIDSSQGLPERTLVVLGKEHSTPANYPRRTGIPLKRPL